MQQHKGMKIEFGGDLEWLNVNKIQTLFSLKPAIVDPPRLFSNLSKDCHPIATKSRQYSDTDRAFIKAEIKRLLSEGIIEPNNSPWSAQIVVVKPDAHKQWLCIDYSHTIN